MVQKLFGSMEMEEQQSRDIQGRKERDLMPWMQKRKEKVMVELGGSGIAHKDKGTARWCIK